MAATSPQEPVVTKTLSFAAVHFCVAFAVGYALTGSVRVGGVMALIEPCCNTVAYYVHEKIWKRRELSRQRLHSALASGCVEV